MKLPTLFKTSILLALSFQLLISCSSSDSPPPTPPPEPFKAYLKASNTDAGDLFGEAVAMSGDGNTIAIGAYAEDGDGLDENDDSVDASGAVYVFKRNPIDTGTWSQVAYLKAPSPAAGDLFGFSVALSEDGSVLAVGAVDRDTGVGPINDTGAVFVFTGANYVDVQTIDPTDTPTTGDRFGESVALSDDGMYLAVGASNKEVNAAAGAGKVYVYLNDGLGTFNIDDTFQAGTPEVNAGFGISVALDQEGLVLAVGAWREGNAPATIDFGAAYVFSRTGLAWNAIGVRLPSAITNDRAGTAVALNDAGTRLAVGAPGDTLGGGATTGKVYVYTLSGTWTADPGSPLTPSNGDNGDVFGASVALDSSGDTLLVGAWLEDGSGTYIDPADDDLALQAGAAYRFERSATPTWDETEYIKATNTAAGDEFGSVAISDDGLHILMGASGEDSNATGVDGNQDNRDGTTNDSGAAYFYDL